MSSMLFELCPLCGGSGRLTTTTNLDPPTERACPSCKPLRVVETGLTAGQAERLVRERGRADALAALLRDCRALLGRAEWGGYSCPSHHLLYTKEISDMVARINRELKE